MEVLAPRNARLLSPARVRGDHEINIRGVLDRILKNGMDGDAVLRRQLAHPLDDPDVVPVFSD